VRIELLTAGDAEVRQRRAAGTMVAAGLAAGDRIAFCLGSSASLLCAVLGALRRGIVPVLLNATLLPAERDVLLEDAEPSVRVLDEASLAALFDGPPAELAPVPLARPMHYTSGTTGRPKGVWSGVLEESEAGAMFDDEADLWGFDAADTHLVCSPMYHSVSVRFAAGTLLRGGRLVVLDRFEPSLAWRALAEHHPTTTFAAPTVLGRLLRHGGGRTTQGLTSLRLLVHAGSPCPADLKREAMACVGPGVLWEFYGSTEGQFTVCSPDEWLARPGTVGRARPGRRIVTDDDGTVWCHAPSFARFSYWRDPEATASAWRGDAFTVGDLGRLDDEGYLYLDGRREDLVITGGVNVYPAEVEAVLGRCPGVTEVAVFGVEDDDWGQQLCAAVVGDSTDQALRAHAESHLAPYKRPKRYLFVDELPRTATGKLQRRLLPEHLGARPADATSRPDQEGCPPVPRRGGT
jgi:acyl-CoA synthetase (AMP-forming)/AMP-acid ligase II